MGDRDLAAFQLRQRALQLCSTSAWQPFLPQWRWLSAPNLRGYGGFFSFCDLIATHLEQKRILFDHIVAEVMLAMSAVADMTLETWNDVIATNLSSAFLAARAQVPAMLARGGGSIVFTSSFVGFSNGGLPGMGAYAAAKAGLIGLTQSLGVEHAPAGIRVNALLPGGTVTPGGGEGDEEAMAFIAGLHPIRRMAAPREIAQAALFLLGDRSSFMTGSPMIVDGGMSARLL